MALRSRDEVIAELTGPGGPFEVGTAVIGGQELPVYRHAPPTLRAVFDTTLGFGDRPFLVYGDDRWSFAEHAARVRALGHHLVDELGVEPGDRVAIGMRNFPEWVVSFWAIQSIGAIAVPLNAWWTGEELAYGLGHSGTVVALLDDERVERLGSELEGLRATLVARGRRSLPAGATPMEEVLAHGDGRDRELADPGIAPDDPASIMYTSGTTGRPKGAIQTHRNHVTNITNTALAGAVAAAVSGAAPDDDPPQPVALQTFPFFHFDRLSGLYSMTAFGGRLVLMYRWDPAEGVRLVVEEGVTSVAGVPTVVRQLLDELDREGVPADGLAGIASGGAPVPPSLIDRVGDRSARRISPANGYGLTETTSAVVVNSGQDYYEHPDSVGRPVPVARVSIRDETGVEVSEGETGELWVRGPNVVAGYWNDPDATATAFTDGWFHTGDAAYVRDGWVYVVDRLKDVVLRGGENVYCAEVEAVLHAIPGVQDVAVVGVPHEVLGEEVAAVVVLEPGSDLTAAELQERAAERLARFKVPAHVFRSDELPRNATGKVLKRDLRAALTAEPRPLASLP